MGTHKNVKRFDYGEMGQSERTPQGFLKVPGFATRVGVFPYLDGDGQIRRELRHPDDVFDPESMATLKYAPVTIEHPPVMLNPSNVAAYSKGHTTERVEVNRDMVDVDLIIEHQDGIDAVEKEGIRELSSGYTADVVEEVGTYNGAPYNFRQKNIRYNHLAMVRRGRAGPEVRMRLDSADAVMRNDEVSVPPAGEFTQEAAISDSEETKRIVVAGREMDLPADVAETMQDLLDRYDEMRAKVSIMEEQMAKQRRDKLDVDINQPGVAPQVKVEQKGPDGESVSGKTPPRPGTVTGPVGKADDEEGHGVVGGLAPNKRDYDEAMDAEEDKDGHEDGDMDDKHDYEPAGGSAAAGGGAAMSPFDKLKADYDALSAKHDEMKSKLDAYAAGSMNQGEAHPDRMDSKTFKTRVQTRVALERKAEKAVPMEIAKRFDSMTDDQIRAAVIKYRNPNADLKDKSSTYLQVRFDSIMEDVEESGSRMRTEAGRRLMGGEERTDAAPEAIEPGTARRTMIAKSREMWKMPLSGSKK